MYPSLRKWLQASLAGLMLVALAGVILRYKIVFPLRMVDQKFLLHGHSHFAFAGWITQALMALIVGCLSEQGGANLFPRYRPVFWANLITAYGMLATFPLVGYAFPSIVFSTLSLFASYAFAVFCWKDMRKIKDPLGVQSWFKMALVCNVLSSVGPYVLAYMMAHHQMQQKLYLASVYFFLHFQYNGWFFFACMGLLQYRLRRLGIISGKQEMVFLLFASSAVPAYFLSVLWWHIPVWLYVLVVLSAICQILGWALVLRRIAAGAGQIIATVPFRSRVLFTLCGIALTIKLLLQAGSVIPSLSKLAFGFRPIVIGYLHLVLLGVISLFILSYLFTFQLIRLDGYARAGILVLVSGIVINELLLMIQGVLDIGYKAFPFGNEMLFGAAILLFTGAVLINISQFFGKDEPGHNSSLSGIGIL